MQETLNKPKPTKREIPDQETKDSWAEDQSKRDYYYDDAHGYEVFDPKDEEDEEKF